MLKTRLIRNGLDMLYRSGVYRALEPVAGGVGIIFTLHRVRPSDVDPERDFAPNAILEITPEFLATAISRAREKGFDTVSLAEARTRLLEGDGRRFAVFTLDDGYRDNLEFAAPVFARHGCPYTIFVATGFVERTAAMWWIGLERAIAACDAMDIEIGGVSLSAACRTAAEKQAAFELAYWPLRAAGEVDRLAAVEGICRRAGIDLRAIAEGEIMGWPELEELARDPLATIGAHTSTHPTLSHLSEGEMRRELVDSRSRIGAMLGCEPRHFAYPYGDESSAGRREFEAARELGFATAVTTRKGVLHPEHADHLTALPRISLNGLYQHRRYVDLFLSGAPFALMNRFRHVDAA